MLLYIMRFSLSISIASLLFSAVAYGQAPVSLLNRVFYEAGTTSMSATRAYGASAYLLNADGSYLELYRLDLDLTAGTGGWLTMLDGTYEYVRTSELQATLRLRPNGLAVTEHRLTFSSDRHGSIAPPPNSGRFHNFWLGSQISPPVAPAPLVNVALRTTLNVGGTAIAGFVVAGLSPRAVVVRAVGPGLSLFGVTTPLGDPKLTVPKLSAPLDRNDDWSTGGAGVTASLRRLETLTGAFPLQSASKDAAIILPELAPGAYTVHVESSPPSGSGEVLIEVYLLP